MSFYLLLFLLIGTALYSALFLLPGGGNRFLRTHSPPSTANFKAQTLQVRNISTCLRTRNSERYILEWIAYHMSLGFNHIYVLDDNSNDHTKQIIQMIQHPGVHFMHMPIYGQRRNEQKQLLPCINLIRKRHRGWYIALDDDEFLVWNQTIPLTSYECESIPMYLFGTIESDTAQTHYTIDRFHFRDKRPYFLSRSLVNLDVNHFPNGWGHYAHGYHNCPNVSQSMLVQHHTRSSSHWNWKKKNHWTNSTSASIQLDFAAYTKKMNQTHVHDPLLRNAVPRVSSWIQKYGSASL